jgi:hypothetical protein
MVVQAYDDEDVNKSLMETEEMYVCWGYRAPVADWQCISKYPYDGTIDSSQLCKTHQLKGA